MADNPSLGLPPAEFERALNDIWAARAQAREDDMATDDETPTVQTQMSGGALDTANLRTALTVDWDPAKARVVRFDTDDWDLEPDEAPPLAGLVTDEDVRVATGAAFPGLPAGMSAAEAERRTRAALDAYGARLLARHRRTL